MRRSAWVPVLVALPLLLGLGASQVLRDSTPPGIWVETPGPAAAGRSADVFLSASEPVTYTVTYGELVLEEVGQDVTLSLILEPGDRVLAVVAEDAAGNRTEVERTLVGIAVPSPRLHVPERVEAGVPVTLELAWEPPNADVRDLGMTAGGVEIPLVRDGDSSIGFVAAPLGTEPSSFAVHAWLVDPFGERHEVSAELAVAADPSPVEELNVPASTLSVITPEGRVREREALDRAYLASRLPELRWREPFLLPVDGVVTSRYGGPRRYAPGGPVSFHTGTDLRAPTGTPIRATNDGVVRVADFYPIKGGLVAIDHGGGVTSLYFHQSEIFVSVGDRVARGDVIGASGATGLVTGPHLHWEMQVLGRPSDPLAWVDRIVPGEVLPAGRPAPDEAGPPEVNPASDGGQPTDAAEPAPAPPPDGGGAGGPADAAPPADGSE